MAPAILVIEDLTAVIERVNLSTFLNLLDGVDRKTDGGLMLIASTNHPDKLDAAVSNRPGRFDVAMELPSPDDAQRRVYFGTRLLEVDAATVDAAVEQTREMSFAHLEEIVHLSGHDRHRRRPRISTGGRCDARDRRRSPCVQHRPARLRENAGSAVRPGAEAGTSRFDPSSPARNAGEAFLVPLPV